VTDETFNTDHRRRRVIRPPRFRGEGARRDGLFVRAVRVFAAGGSTGVGISYQISIS
jgi:hypothetical protein